MDIRKPAVRAVLLTGMDRWMAPELPHREIERRAGVRWGKLELQRQTVEKAEKLLDFQKQP